MHGIRHELCENSEYLGDDEFYDLCCRLQDLEKKQERMKIMRRRTREKADEMRMDSEESDDE